MSTPDSPEPPDQPNKPGQPYPLEGFIDFGNGDCKPIQFLANGRVAPQRKRPEGLLPAVPGSGRVHASQSGLSYRFFVRMRPPK